jgi:hypothetical protein
VLPNTTVSQHKWTFLLSSLYLCKGLISSKYSSKLRFFSLTISITEHISSLMHVQ